MSRRPPLHNKKYEQAIEFAQEQVRTFINKQPDTFPVYTINGKWKQNVEAWTNWCEGFLGGLMWIFYTRTDDEWWRAKAEHYSQLLEYRKTDRAVHDLGFIFWSTWKRWFDLAGAPEINNVIITAGKTMGLRYIENGAYFHSFVAPESLFIDIMMNIGIIFYAAIQTEDKTLLEKTNKHCLTTRRCLVRGNGSTAHEGIFDIESGEFIKQTTHQGYRGDSTWARGLAWSLYGFATAYQMTNDYRFLQTSMNCADYYITHTSFNDDAAFGPGIPPNDFDDPRKPILPDSSAAAIAASGLLTLANLVQEPIWAERYQYAAVTILNTLCGPNYLADETPGWEGIIRHGIYHQPKGS